MILFNFFYVFLDRNRVDRVKSSDHGFLLLSLIIMISCSSPAVANPKMTNNDTANFPIQELTILHPHNAVNLRLSYIRTISTDSSDNYLVLATHNGKKIGFELQMPPEGKASARLISLGQPSDDFLRVLQTAYHQSAKKNSHFADTVKVDCFSFGAYVDSLKKNGQGDYVTKEQNKLFFASQDPNWEAECYLIINLSDHWIELHEEDADYRQSIIKDLCKP